GSEPAYTGEQLFADYFIAGELEIVPQRGGTITAEVARNETLYRQSLKLITLHNPALPIENFTYLSSLPDFEYREEAGWTLALIYVKHNRREQAKEALRPLIVSKSFYASKASELSRKLDETRWFN
ncbi:MAG: hypothetical protein LBM08_00075, partial [Dysgonamonadaceae bacterium]|nr:hypothetical protein [Dysgonamonadaceae bacterium]